ncbi:MAG: hypothetical protein M3Q27_02055 [Actinomycetota bacterium]|nr:hypothetical protein [Actinomycetota bacterium]
MAAVCRVDGLAARPSDLTGRPSLAKPQVLSACSTTASFRERAQHAPLNGVHVQDKADQVGDEVATVVVSSSTGTAT